MKAQHLFAAMGLSLAICAPSIAPAQIKKQAHAKPAAQQSQQQYSKTGPVYRSGLPPGFFDQNVPRARVIGPGDQSKDPGDQFTDSTMRSVTRAGEIDVITGTAGNDVNGQVGTTNQGNLVHGPMGGIFTSHFGSGGSHKQTPIRAHRSPRPKRDDH